MKTIQVNNITLQYDESIEDIERINRIIELNPMLFLGYKEKTISLVPMNSSTNGNIVYVDNFDRFFDDLLKRTLDDNNIALSLTDSVLLPALYMNLLAKQSTEENEKFIMLDDSVSEDVMWFLTACKYFDYKTQFHELAHFLKYRNDSEKIFAWLGQTQRFKTYNYLLGVAAKYLQKYDTSFFNKMDEIIFAMRLENMKFAIHSGKIDHALEAISFEEFETIFWGFLHHIKAPQPWQDIYVDIRDNKKVIWEESKDGSNHSQVFVDTDGVKKIKVTTDGTIKFFVSFVHEFIHYVNWKNNDLAISLSEFPSIYYEKVAAAYLVGLGFEENIIQNIVQDRAEGNFLIYSFLVGLLEDIYHYSKMGPITREEKTQPYETTKKIIGDLNTELENLDMVDKLSLVNLDFLTKLNADFGVLADKECDMRILQFAKEGLSVLDGYQYLVGNFLANSVLEKEDDDIIADKMNYLTDHLGDFTIESASEYLGIENTFDTTSVSKVKK